MSPVAPFEYDAFISYSSADRPWAKQLHDDLTDRNFKVFFDRTGLDVGEDWRDQLDVRLDSSQHLVVLWSRNADKSKYVPYERIYFHTKARGTTAPARREILVQLEDPVPTVLNEKQMITDIKDSGSYAKGFPDRDINAWARVLGRVEKTIRDQSSGLRVLVAVLATTRDSLDRLDFDKVFRGFGSMNSVMAAMGIRSKADLLEHYGNTPDDWRPFGDEANIWTVLENLKRRVSDATLKKFQIDWEPIGSDLWSTDIATAKREATRLVTDLSLVVIDPISLVDDQVKDGVELIRHCFSNAQSAVMVLTPYRMLEPSVSLRNIVQSRALSFFDLFYEPPVPPSSPVANFGVNIGDEVDMNRLVLMTLGQYVGRLKPVNSFINPRF
jgi:hypothetical protein